MASTTRRFRSQLSVARTLALLAASALLLASCGPKQANTMAYVDPDGDMGTANGLFFDMPPVDDRINPGGGDREDWRYIVVPAEGNMSVTLNVDNPSVTGTWYLLDREGRIVHTEQIDPSRSFYELPQLPVLPGRYHFRFQAEKGASVYSLGASFQETAPAPVVAVQVDDEEDEDEAEPERRRRHRRRARRVERRRARRRAPAEDAETVTTGTREVVGTITRATEKDDGTIDVVIRGIGTSVGVDKGMRGKVKGFGAKVKIDKCSSRKCDGVVKGGATARDLREHDKVVFKVP